MSRAASRGLRACVLGVLALALLTVGMAAPAQAATSDVTGDIKLYDGASPAGVQVRLVQGGSISDPVTVDSTGQYTFSQVNNGPGYYIVATFPDSNPSRSKYSAYNGSNLTFNVPRASKADDAGRFPTLQPTIGCTTTINGFYQAGSTLSAATAYDTGGTVKTISTSWYRYTDPARTTEVGTGTSYTLTDADVGSHIGFTSQFQNAGGGRDGRCRTADSTSAPTVAARRSGASGSSALVGGVGIAGKHRTKKTVSAVVSLKPGATVGYQWYRVTTKASRGRKSHHGVRIRPIKGANATAYRIRGKDRGARLFVRVSAGGPGYATTVLDSGWIKIRR